VACEDKCVTTNGDKKAQLKETGAFILRWI